MIGCHVGKWDSNESTRGVSGQVIEAVDLRSVWWRVMVCMYCMGDASGSTDGGSGAGSGGDGCSSGRGSRCEERPGLSSQHVVCGRRGMEGASWEEMGDWM